MVDGIHDESTTFLSRWSRLKRDAQEAEPNAAAPLHADQSDAVPVQHQQKEAHAESEAPPLPPVDELTPDSDFRGFLHPKVNEDVRRAALKKLFSDPHFNVMDGLDTYIDDYSKSDPLPLDMLAQMKSAQKIFHWAKNEGDEDESTAKPTETAPAQQDANAVPNLDASAPADGGVPTQVTAGTVDEMEAQPAASNAATPSSDTPAQD